MLPITHAMRVAAEFERQLWELQRALGERAPSREVVIEAARRDPRRGAIEVVTYWRAHHRGPEPLR